MKTIIAGSRDITEYSIVEKAVAQSGIVITEVVSGGARGVDRLGEQYAMENCLPVKKFKANWQCFGKSAGMVRNHEMARYASALIAIWDGKSAGTKGMIDIAQKQGLWVYVYMTGDQDASL